MLTIASTSYKQARESDKDRNDNAILIGCCEYYMISLPHSLYIYIYIYMLTSITITQTYIPCSLILDSLDVAADEVPSNENARKPDLADRASPQGAVPKLKYANTNKMLLTLVYIRCINHDNSSLRIIMIRHDDSSRCIILTHPDESS